MGWTVNELMCSTLLMRTVQMTEAAKTKVEATKAVGRDIMGAEVVLCGIKADKPRLRIDSSGIART